MLAFLLIMFIAGLVVAGPLMTIWALNTLFMMGIPFTVWTWIATLWLQMIVVGVFKYKSKE